MGRSVEFQLMHCKNKNPWILAKCAMQKKLTNHPDFAWTSLHLKDKQVMANLANVKAMAGKSHHGQRFKFGVQIPHDTSHAIHLDTVSNNNLWKAATNTELDSINEFETFKMLKAH